MMFFWLKLPSHQAMNREGGGYFEQPFVSCKCDKRYENAFLTGYFLVSIPFSLDHTPCILLFFFSRSYILYIVILLL